MTRDEALRIVGRSLPNADLHVKCFEELGLLKLEEHDGAAAWLVGLVLANGHKLTYPDAQRICFFLRKRYSLPEQ